MVIRVFISGVSGNHEIRKQQQRVQFVLESLKLEFDVIDITETGREEDRNFMREECKKHDRPNALPPQIFNGDIYCGDYNDFEAANEEQYLMKFLKLENQVSTAEITCLQKTCKDDTDISNIESVQNDE
ncbi:SH3 domain-binding glutamic acid-rich protein homolog [Centruroides sculpturatus]|uniref:SH3 domain-binding glutamic acid-rich protein homolog n=1 Tax=Centruroides sculpturatus TaxID=218467 RepID=UPI000C6D3621|nr:SH3 domain-binding glutamic acid-rich protein homolog [Centruroides sculpturatus]